MILLTPETLDFSAVVRPGDCVAWGQAGAEPVPLTTLLMSQRKAIGKFSVFIGTTWSNVADPDFTDCVSFISYCGAARNRLLAKAGALDIVPCHYSELGKMIRSGPLKIDVLLIQVAPCNQSGRYSLSIAHEYLIAAIDTARIVVAEINDQTPWTFGERPVFESDIDLAIVTSRPLTQPDRAAHSVADRAIAAHVASLIEDGSTLQFGIGALPQAILAQLGDRRDLGVHTGALVDEAAILASKGVINNSRKSIDRGVTIAGVMMGGSAVYDYAHENPCVQFRSVDYTHSRDVLAGIERFVAINSALEVDLTGQINAEVAGDVYVGGVGGALDFLRGAHYSEGGLPIVALPSTAGGASKPVSRIVSRLHGPVSTPRCDAGLIVTEHGIADLRGLSLAQRSMRMLEIADPQFRESLEKSAKLTSAWS
jgi:acyl-CoA hydrolase